MQLMDQILFEYCFVYSKDIIVIFVPYGIMYGEEQQLFN